MSKACYYTKKSDGVDSMEEMNERLAADLRRAIRQLDNYPILSDNWFEMADTFGRLASIAEVEAALPGSKDKDSTLWETEEQALRFLVEDGKLNLSLRLLIDYHIRIRTARGNPNDIIHQFHDRCSKFEKGLGNLLRVALGHVEVAQTLDLPALATHIGTVLSAATNLPPAAVAKNPLHAADVSTNQEGMVFHYVLRLLSHAEDISESRILPFLRDARVFELGIITLTQFDPQTSPQLLLVACQALAALATTEDFITHREDWINIHDPTILNHITNARETVIAKLLTDFDVRRFVRPLADALDKIIRSSHK